MRASLWGWRTGPSAAVTGDPAAYAGRMGRARAPGLLPRWVAANALGELVGLGGTGLIGVAYFRYAGEPAGVPAVLAAFGVAVGSGVVEATVLGLAQHWAVRPWLPALRARRWWFATLWGALAAYVLGWLPSTLLSLGSADDPAQAAVTGPPQGAVLLAAAALGLAAGAVLAFAQALELRRHIAHAWRWIPANMLAWAVGMPLVFLGIDLVAREQPLWRAILLAVATLLATGAAVGVINGSFLARLLTPRLRA